MERRHTQLRGDSTIPFQLLSVPKVNTEETLSKLQKRPLPANPSSLSFPARRPADRPAKRVKESLKESRKIDYHEFLKLDQGGPAVIASDNTENCSIVAIKRSKVRARDNSIRPLSVCSNIVELIDVFDRDGDTFMVYEQMDVSLRLINSIPGLDWSDHEIAAVCKEVLCGLAFIHQGLSHYYGELDCNTVLLDRDGQIKLANIGDCMLEERRLTESMEREDTRSVGFMMMELMEADTSMMDPKSVRLQRPHKWNKKTGILEFLAATQTSLREQLYKHPFLPQESLRKYLKPHVFTALISAKTDWDLIAQPVTSIE